MPYTELLGWFVYFEKRPPEWRSDDRSAKLMQAWGVKEKVWNIFPSLKNIYNPPQELKDGQISTKNLMKSRMFQFLKTSTGGDTIDFNKTENKGSEYPGFGQEPS